MTSHAKFHWETNCTPRCDKPKILRQHHRWTFRRNADAEALLHAKRATSRGVGSTIRRPQWERRPEHGCLSAVTMSMRAFEKGCTGRKLMRPIFDIASAASLYSPSTQAGSLITPGS